MNPPFFKSCCFIMVNTIIAAAVVNEFVTREVNIQTPLIKERVTVVIRNKLNKSLNTYEFEFGPYVDAHFIEFFNNRLEKLFHINPTDSKTKYNVFLDSTIGRNETYALIIEFAYVGGLIPYQKYRRFNENQSLLYNGNLHFYSPYRTISSRIIIVCKPNSNLRMNINPQAVVGNNLTYFRHDFGSYSTQELRIIFDSNDPILVVYSLFRIVNVSHFGKIFIEDHIVIKNEGSKLVGPYHQQLGQTPIAASSWLYTHLPASASDIQFFDQIGNNSKSHIFYFNDYATLKHQPRFPLLGGWKYPYIIRYSLPTHEYLKRNLKDFFSLSVRAIDHVINDGLIKRATVQILLPEGAYLLEVKVPEWFAMQTNASELTSLCLFGRPTVILNGENLLESHISEVKVTYLYSMWHLLHVPLLIASYLETVFLIFIIYSRLRY